MSAFNRSPEDRYSRGRYRERSRSRSRSPGRSERRRSRERYRKSRWHDDDYRERYDDRRDRQDDRLSTVSGRRSRFSDRNDDREPDREREYNRERGFEQQGRERDYRRRERYDESSWREEGYNDSEDNRRDRLEEERSRQLSSIPPGPILMFRNLLPSILKEHLTQALGHQMSYIKDIRLINGRDNASNYAFVEFYTTDDAINWMEANRNGFEVRGCHVNIDFSHHRSIDGGDKRRKEFRWSDWNCFKCGTLNFSRRTVCLTCDCPRTESDSLHEDRRAGLLPELEAEEDPSKNNPPSNVLILRGLDSHSNEESIQKAIAEVSQITIKDIRLIRDKATNTSRRFCFVETITTEEAAELHKTLQEQYPAFFVDGRRINVSYARVNSSLPKPVNAVAEAAIQQARAMNISTSSQWQQQTQQQQQQQYYYPQSTSNSTDSFPVTQEHTTSQEQPAPGASTTAQAGVPSTYLYDSTSGFYYDSITGLYYDPKTQYHYNSQTGQYCYYDNTKQAYIPVTADGTPIASETTSESADDQSKEKKKKDIPVVSTGKSAKKIAKDMERWAKSVNTQKAIQQQMLNQMTHPPPEITLTEPHPQHSNTSIPEHEEHIPFGLQDVSATDSPASAVYVQAEEDPQLGGVSELEHIDLSQMACLLCKRKFNSKEQLMKHTQLSDLHKQNLEKLRQQPQASSQSTEQLKYRDRAKERRAKYGTDAIVPGWKKRFERERAKGVIDGGESAESVLPNVNESEAENIGSKMLKAMGWNEGQGLGREGQGITKPIEAEKRTPSAGLGAPGSNYGVYSGGNDYRSTLKSLTKARYDQTFDD